MDENHTIGVMIFGMNFIPFWYEIHTVRLVQACLYAGKTDNAVLTAEEGLRSTCRPV